MASRCEITGKGKQYGHNVSFSLRRTPKVWKPNLQKKTLIVNGQKIRLTVSTSAIRTLKKNNAFARLAGTQEAAATPKAAPAGKKPAEKAAVAA